MSQPSNTSSTSYEIPNFQAFASLAMLILHLVIITCALGYAHAETLRQTVGLELAQGGPELPAMKCRTHSLAPRGGGSRCRLESPTDSNRRVRAL